MVLKWKFQAHLKKQKKKLKNLEKNLYTKNMSNPDILIRTGGSKKIK